MFLHYVTFLALGTIIHEKYVELYGTNSLTMIYFTDFGLKKKKFPDGQLGKLVLANVCVFVPPGKKAFMAWMVRRRREREEPVSCQN